MVINGWLSNRHHLRYQPMSHSFLGLYNDVAGCFRSIQQYQPTKQPKIQPTTLDHILTISPNTKSQPSTQHPSGTHYRLAQIAHHYSKQSHTTPSGSPHHFKFPIIHNTPSSHLPPTHNIPTPFACNTPQ